MSYWEGENKSDEHYTPKYVFDALGCQFDLDVAAPIDRSLCHVPADSFITEDSLAKEWYGFVWCNPPYGGRNSKVLWLDKMHTHGNGIALLPDRTSAPWWQAAAFKSRAILFVAGKIKFLRPDGSIGNQPSNGTCLFAYGYEAVEAIRRAEKRGLGLILIKP